MKYIKKNIWELFVVTMLTGLLILTYVIYAIWAQVSLRYKLEQENVARISANSTFSLLSQHEVTLDLLGEYLIKDDTYKDTQKSTKILQSLLKTNSSIAGFGLYDTSGNLYVTSINKDINKLPNLSQKKETKDSFEKALSSDFMVLGRTYYHDTLQTYLIPIRKAIRDENKNIVAVMTAGIRVDSWYESINQKKSVAKYKSFLLRNDDYYLQLVPPNSGLSEDYYNKKISLTYANKIQKQIESSNNTTIQIMKNNQAVVSAKYEHFLVEKKVFGSVVYISKYNLWKIVQVDNALIMNDFYKKATPILVIFVFTGGFLFFLFYQLNKVTKRNRKELEYQAEHDYLTDLHNRHYLSKKFDNILLSNSFTLIVLNMDNFKNINENYGHECGDLTLKEIGKRLNSIKNKDDIIARYSGDEFLFIRHNISRDDSPTLAQKIIELLYIPYKIGGFYFVLGASLGIAGYPANGNSFNDLKKYADIALREAKKKKNTYMFFEDSIKQKYLRHSLIEQELKIALLQNEIYMVYQPQIRADGSFYGVEALARWKHEKLGLIPPDEFIKIAENTGVMVSLGQYIIDKSLKDINDIQKQTNTKFNLSINISLMQFIELDFFEQLLISIKNINFDKSNLSLEVTENIFIEDIEEMLRLLLEIRKEGIKISLDDFGTGYSSLSLLKKLPIDELKIDKSFVYDLQSDIASEKMISAIIMIAKQLNIKILAEGIEKAEQKKMLTKQGCDMFQGYYFSKPICTEDLKELVQKWY